jgi:hypothetical protein
LHIISWRWLRELPTDTAADHEADVETINVISAHAWSRVE